MTGVISDSDTQLLWEAMEANPGLELQLIYQPSRCAFRIPWSASKSTNTLSGD